MDFSQDLRLTRIDEIPGLLVLDLPVHGDNRGWFKENWQREKMAALGLPDFGPVQHNISYNLTAGTTRGIHAEPWDKYVSVAVGEVFAAWVDLREGPTFGRSYSTRLDASRAVFVPRGVGNAFQALAPGTAYSYLVNAHWSAEAQERYTFLDLADRTAGIDWPIPLADAELSARDRAHPPLEDVVPVAAPRIAVLGADGQLGRALRERLGEERAVFLTRAEADLTDPEALARLPWDSYSAIINAAAYTRVDEAETPAGRAAAWDVNAAGTAALARLTAAHRLPLVHVSTDYVFDGAADRPYREDDPVAPLGAYGQSKAAGEQALALHPRCTIVRTSWLIGDGPNFVRTMAGLAARAIEPSVVDDQRGRLTFATDLADAIVHLLDAEAPAGTYHVSNSGEPMTWADVARAVFAHVGADPERVAPVSTDEYFAGRRAADGDVTPKPVAPRPRNSVFDLSRIIATGFTPRDQAEALAEELGRYRAAAGTGAEAPAETRPVGASAGSSSRPRR